METVLEFLKNVALQDEGLGDAGIETFRETPYASAAKEAGQNSRDAMDKRPVHVKMRLFGIGLDDIPCGGQLSETIDCCLNRVAENKDEKEQDFFNRARSVLDAEKIKVLEIADYNTNGLIGPAKPGKPFYALLKSSGVSRKQAGETSIGSFGIGKNASFAISDLQTVFYSTLYKDESTGETQFLAQGKSKLVSHTDVDGVPRSATGWWGIENYKEIQDPEVVPEWLRREEIGTSVFALGFREEADWQYRVTAAILKTFFAAIHDGDMIFEVNDELMIDRSALNNLFQDQRVVEAAAASHANDDFNFARNLYECLVSEEATSKTVTIEQVGSTLLGDVDIRILKRQGLPKRVGIVRNGMMITDNLRHFDHKFSQFPMCSDFVALVRPIADSGSKLLKKLENPAHDSFSSQRISDETKQSEAFRAVNKLGGEIRKKIRAETQSKPEDVERISELAEFFADENKSDEEGNEDPTPTRFKYKLDRNKKRSTKMPGGGSGSVPVPVPVPVPPPPVPPPPPPPPRPVPPPVKGGQPIPIDNIRYIERPSSKTLHLTPSSTQTAEIKAYASGMSGTEPLSIVSASQGSVENGTVRMDFEENKRIELSIEYEEDYSGPIEIVAHSIEENSDAN